MAQLPAGFHDVAYATGLSQPIAIAFAADGRLFVAEKTGAIKVVQGGQVVSTFTTLTVESSSERGLLGLALDPDFPSHPHVYVYYTATSGSLNPPSSPKNRVSRLTANGNLVVAGSETILLDGIPSDAGNHNAGCLRFAPDGTLFIATGDGGANAGNSQNLLSLGGKILRIHQNGTIPIDNPYYGSPNAHNEIFCRGLRNPFRFTFRPGTSTLFIGDVGASAWEEVNVGVAAGNYGWPLYEGPSNAPGYISPVHAYPHTSTSRGCITGGSFVVKKRFPPPYDGSYFYGDYVRGVIRRAQFSAANAFVSDAPFSTANGPVEFQESPEGDLYYVSLNSGAVRRVYYRTHLTSVAAAPSSVMGGKSTTGTVRIDHPAPAAGALIFLTSTSGAAVPASVRILGGQTSIAFPITTSTRLTQANATITASRNGVTKTGNLSIFPTSQASFVAQSVPSSMGLSQKVAVSVTMHNPGPSTWTHNAGFRLLSYNPSANKFWGLDRMYLPPGVSVAPGQNYTFSATVTAPATPGSYNFQWRMLLQGLGTFGQPSSSVIVSVQ